MAALNPTLFKLKVMQSRCPIYTGQILPLVKDKLRTNQEDSLNNAEMEHPFYSVKSVSRQNTYSSGKGKGEMYHLALMPVEWDAVNMAWGPCASVSPHPFDISISSEEMYNTFGVHTKHTSKQALERKTISKEVEKLFKRAKKHKDWLEKYQNVDFDRIVRDIALKVLSKNSEILSKEDKEDIFQNVIARIFSERDLVEQYDESRGPFINFFWGCLYNEFMKEIRNFYRTERPSHKINLRGPSDDMSLSEEEQLTYLSSPGESAESALSTKDLLKNFQEFLRTKLNSDILIGIAKGFENSDRRVDIAKDLGISKENLNYHVIRFVKYLREYAIISDNETLLAAIEEGMSKNRKEGRVAAESDLLSEIFDNYKDQSGQSERVGESKEKLAERVPVGSTIRIKRRELPSFEDLTKQVVQDPERSATQATKDVEAYLQEITSADELIEQDGKLIALRVHRQE